jgi:hypothetical protein
MFSLDINPLLSIYLTGKWRYPASPELDIPDKGNTTGMAFMPKIGFELFHSWPVSVLLEAGLVKSWESGDDGINYTASAAVVYRIQ